jgi:hypothetical protein
MRPVLLGIDNPHSKDPDDALSVYPVGASGYRLWLMIKEAANRAGRDFSEGDYMNGFDRRNLFSSENYSQGKLVRVRVFSSLARREVVMLGTKVPTALGFKHTGFDLKPRDGGMFRYYVVPHPSGLCREYNDPEMRVRVGNLLLKLLRRRDSDT